MLHNRGKHGSSDSYAGQESAASEVPLASNVTGKSYEIHAIHSQASLSCYELSEDWDISMNKSRNRRFAKVTKHVSVIATHIINRSVYVHKGVCII